MSGFILKRLSRPYNQFLRAVSCAFMLVLLSGCIAVNDHRGRMVDQENLAKLKVNIDDQETVRQTIGSPTFEDKFNPRQWVYVYQYTSRRSFFHPDTINFEVVRAHFNDKGVLTKLDHLQAQTIPEVQPVSRVTETSGHRNTFAQQLLGNFGKYRQKK